MQSTKPQFGTAEIWILLIYFVSLPPYDTASIRRFNCSARDIRLLSMKLRLTTADHDRHAPSLASKSALPSPRSKPALAVKANTSEMYHSNLRF